MIERIRQSARRNLDYAVGLSVTENEPAIFNSKGSGSPDAVVIGFHVVDHDWFVAEGDVWAGGIA